MAKRKTVPANPPASGGTGAGTARRKPPAKRGGGAEAPLDISAVVPPPPVDRAAERPASQPQADGADRAVPQEAPNTDHPLSQAGAAPQATGGASESSASGNEPTFEQIAEAAYHRYLQRGGGDGQDFDDWVEAERDLRSRSGRQ